MRWRHRSCSARSRICRYASVARLALLDMACCCISLRACRSFGIRSVGRQATFCKGPSFCAVTFNLQVHAVLHIRTTLLTALLVTHHPWCIRVLVVTASLWYRAGRSPLPSGFTAGCSACKGHIPSRVLLPQAVGKSLRAVLAVYHPRRPGGTSELESRGALKAIKATMSRFGTRVM